MKSPTPAHARTRWRWRTPCYKSVEPHRVTMHTQRACDFRGCSVESLAPRAACSRAVRAWGATKTVDHRGARRHRCVAATSASRPSEEYTPPALGTHPCVPMLGVRTAGVRCRRYQAVDCHDGAPHACNICGLHTTHSIYSRRRAQPQARTATGFYVRQCVLTKCAVDRVRK